MDETDRHASVKLDSHELVTLVTIWRRVKSRRSLNLFWRDRLSYQVFDLHSDSIQVLAKSEQDHVLFKVNKLDDNADEWRYKSNTRTLEAASLQPHTPQLDDILSIEETLVRRRQLLESCMHTDQAFLTTSVCRCPQTRTWATSKSYSSANAVINAQNSMVPIQDHICESTLKIDFNAHDLREARYLYDQLYVLTPIMLAMTAGRPLDHDHSQAAEIGTPNVTDRTVNKIDRSHQEYREFSRPLSYPTFLSADSPRSREAKCELDQETFKVLRDEGLDEAMATFFAQKSIHLQWSDFLRSVCRDRDSSERNDNSTDYVLSLGSHVRFRLPPLNDTRIGFGIEFCSIEAQLTDFANAAYIFFIALLRFTILGFELDFRIAPELMAENNERAYRNNAVSTEKFWWRMARWRVDNLHLDCASQHITTDAQPSLVSLDHVMNGDPSRPETIGLSGVVEAYLADIDDDSEAGSFIDDISTTSHQSNMSQISEYLTFVRQRAKGTAWTDARWTQNFVNEHPKQDGVGLASPDVFRDFVASVKKQNSRSVERFASIRKE